MQSKLHTISDKNVDLKVTCKRAKHHSDEAKWLERKCCKNQLYFSLTGMEQKTMDPRDASMEQHPQATTK